MITWLHSFSNFSLVLSLLVVGLLITVIIPVYVRKFFKLEPNEHMGQGAEEAFKIIVSIVLLLIAFSLVQTQGDHQNADALVAKESALIIKLHRALDAYGDEAKSQQAELVAYAKSIANDEWPALATGKRSAATTTALVKLGQDASIKIDAYDSAIYGGLRGKVDYISADALFAEKASPGVPIGPNNPPIYYIVRVRITGSEFHGEKAREIKMRPGLTASVEIKALERSVLSYLTKPITKTFDQALGER